MRNLTVGGENDWEAEEKEQQRQMAEAEERRIKYERFQAGRRKIRQNIREKVSPQ